MRQRSVSIVHVSAAELRGFRTLIYFELCVCQSLRTVACAHPLLHTLTVGWTAHDSTRSDPSHHTTHAVIYLSQYRVLHSTRSAVSRVPAATPMCHLRVPDRTLSVSRHVRLMTLRGRTMHRDRIPTAQWQCPEIPPPHRIPTCPCSTSVNSTPLQRSKAQPPQFPFRENL